MKRITSRHVHENKSEYCELWTGNCPLGLLAESDLTSICRGTLALIFVSEIEL
jgi:hypothetical protein